MTIASPRPTRDLPADIDASLEPIPAALRSRAVRPGVVIRHAHPDEYAEVGDVLESAFTTGCWVTEEYRRSLHAIADRARTSHVWVAVDAAGVLAAVLTPQPRYHTGDRFTFNILGVGPRGRGAGWGREMTDHAVQVARSLGHGVVEIHSGPQMTAAHRVYERYGFVRRLDWETVVVDGGQRLLSFTYRIPDPVVPAPVVVRQTPPRSPSSFAPPGGPVNLSPLRPVGSFDDSGLFLPAPPTRPAPAVLPDASLRLEVPRVSPRTWGPVFVLRASGLEDRIPLVWTDAGTSPRLVDASGAVVTDDWAGLPTTLAHAASGATASTPEADAWADRVATDLIAPLEAALFSESQAAREATQRAFYAQLGLWELRLSTRRYVTGDTLTHADLALLGLLSGFDVGYRSALGWAPAALVDHPHLWAWARDVWQTTGVVTPADRQALGLAPRDDGQYAEDWGTPARIDTVTDVRAAWDTPLGP